MAAIAAMTVALFSCKDDEKPVIPVVNFQQAARTVGEDAGTIDVQLTLDVDAPQDIKVRYALSGTASEGTSTSTSADYQVLGTYGEITIAKGASSGTLQLQIKQDASVEADETIIVTITDIVNEAGTVGTTPATTITLQSDDQGAKVSFAAATKTVKESDGLVDIELTLDKAASQDLTVEYSFNYTDDGVPTALDSLYAFNEGAPTQYYDFYVAGGTYGKITIPAGSTTAKVQLMIYSDFLLEDDELIEMTLTSVSAGGTLGTNTKYTVTVAQEDGKAIGLVWEDTYKDVDMDMFLWVGEDEASLRIAAFSFNESVTVRQELLFIPKAITDGFDLTFGLSFVYYSGTANPMNFESHFVDFSDGEFEANETRDIFSGTYSLANLNKWDDEATGKDPQVEQVLTTVSGVYDIGDITTPTTGSRQASHELPANLSKNKNAFKQFSPIRGLRK